MKLWSDSNQSTSCGSQLNYMIWQMYFDILQWSLSTIQRHKSALSFSDPGMQTISMLMLYLKHVLSIPRANVYRTVLVLSLLTMLTTIWLSINHCIFLPSKRFIYDNSTIIAVSYFHVELLRRSTPNHIPWTMLIGVLTM